MIVDTFHGQYKSTLLCPKCRNYSYTYDPFNSLSLPIPQNNNTRIIIYFIKNDPRHLPIKLACDIPENASLFKVRELVANMLAVNPNSFMFTCIIDDVVVGFPNDEKKVDLLKKATLFAYQEDGLDKRYTAELQITKERNRKKMISFSRLIFPSKNGSCKSLHHEIFKRFSILVDKSGEFSGTIREMYEKFVKNSCYLILFKVGRGDICGLCRSDSCEGCAVPYSDKPLSQIFLGKSKIVLEMT